MSSNHRVTNIQFSRKGRVQLGCCSQKCDIERWQKQCATRLGVHMFGQTIGQAWSPGTLKFVSHLRLSIHPLELMAAAAAIELLHTRGSRDNSQIVLPCDNTPACCAANTGATYSLSMKFALKIFAQACERRNVALLLWYISSKDNVIADAISRGAWKEAERRVTELGWEFERNHHVMMRNWE